MKKMKKPKSMSMFVRVILSLIIPVLVFMVSPGMVSAAQGSCGDDWASCHGIQTVADGCYYGVASNELRTVVVGWAGIIEYSDNGQDWTVADSGNAHYYGITHGKNMFVAVGGGGLIKTSVNGITWTERDSGVVVDLKGVVYNGSVFTVVGAGGTVLTSGDGVTWTLQYSGTIAPLNAVSASEAGTVLAVGNSGHILRSVDNGATWTVLRVGENAVYKHFYSTAFGNGVFIVGGASGWIFRSSDEGVTWSGNTGLYANSCMAATFAGDQFIVACDFIGGTPGAPVLTSEDGTAWNTAYADTNKNLYAVTWTGSEAYVAGADTRVFRDNCCKVYPVPSNYEQLPSDMRDSRVTSGGSHINGDFASILYLKGQAKPYRMWYTDMSGGSRTVKFRASVDGRDWTAPMAVTGLTNADHVQVVYLEDINRFRIYYWDTTQSWGHYCIRTAFSVDGLTWYYDQPIGQNNEFSLFHPPADGYYGSKGPIAAFYNAEPSVTMKTATGNDSPFDFRYTIFYDYTTVYNGNHSSTCIAVSDNGINFYEFYKIQRMNLGWEPTFILEHGDWDSKFITFGSVVPKHNEPGTWLFYYSGGKDSFKEAVGVAVSTDNGRTWTKGKWGKPIHGAVEPGYWYSSGFYAPTVLYGQCLTVPWVYQVWASGRDEAGFTGIGYFFLW